MQVSAHLASWLGKLKRLVKASKSAVSGHARVSRRGLPGDLDLQGGLQPDAGHGSFAPLVQPSAFFPSCLRVGILNHQTTRLQTTRSEGS